MPRNTHKPQPANSLAQLVQAVGTLPPGQQFASAAAMFAAAAPGTPKHICTSGRGVMRRSQAGVGRGRRYGTITPKAFVANYKALQAAGAQAASSKRTAKAKAKATSKAAA